jgi:signal transduction histidine kinase
MGRLRGSIAFRLSVGYGLLVVGSMVVIAALFYFGTVGVLGRGNDRKLAALSERLTAHYQSRGLDELRLEVERLLIDGVDQDTEAYLLVNAAGQRIAGNLSGAAFDEAPLDRLSNQRVIRSDHPSVSRILPTRLSNGALLVVGRDIQDQLDIEHLVIRALLLGGAVAVPLAIGGAVLFRRELERRIAAIRWTAWEIGAGDMSRRVPEAEADDEFSRLTRDINSMLDRISQLMDGVRHVSNTIAHDLRRPLGQLRAQLDEALWPCVSGEQRSAAMRVAIREIDELVAVFDALLQIAEAESGAPRRAFERVTLRPLVENVVELYDAVAEANGLSLVTDIRGEPIAFGDPDLLMSAVSNLVDNAIKYGGQGVVRVSAGEEGDAASIRVSDTGPGIPLAERENVTKRFYRLRQNRDLPGSGLGLSIVTAVAELHAGRLHLEDGAPGLIARLVLPRGPTALPNVNVAATVGIVAPH